MVVQRQELATKVAGLAQGAITAGTEIAGHLIRGYLRQAVSNEWISAEQKEEALLVWEELRRDIDAQKPRGVTEVRLGNFKICLDSLVA